MMSSRTAALVSMVVVASLYAAFRFIGQSDWLLVPAEWANAADGALKVALWVLPCAAAVLMIERVPVSALLDRLGLRGNVAAGFAFGLVAALPMLAVYRGAGTLHLAASSLLGSVVLSPFAEEVLFRGYLLGALRARAGWPLRTAILASGLAFGLAHFGNVDPAAPGARVAAIGAVGATAAAGVLFGWIVYRWNSLWPAVGLHSFLNLSWEVFGVSDWSHHVRASGAVVDTSLANTARIVSVVVAIYLTWRLTRRRAAEIPPVSPGSRLSPFES